MKVNLLNPKECTLCMACANVCPRNAIELTVSDSGYEILKINRNTCINCGSCNLVCRRRKQVQRSFPKEVYAAQMKSKKDLKKSASGGAFQSLAQLILEEGGVCYGSWFRHKNGRFCAEHIRIDKEADLPKILNSKYIPSIIGNVYYTVQEDLKKGLLVLFCGTPCQVQGLKAYLASDYPNLITADLICHGITSTKMFNDYIDSTEKCDKIRIIDYHFRDKDISWGTNYCYTYQKGRKIKTKHCPREASSYMAHYLRGNIFRENCYDCQLANAQRVSDFTLGDFWAIEKTYPQLATSRNNRISIRDGINCILVNTENAQNYVDKLKYKMTLHPVSSGSVIDNNDNLRFPSTKGKKREDLLVQYRENGYMAIEKEYRQTMGKRIHLYNIKNFIKSYMPDRVRILLYGILFS